MREIRNVLYLLVALPSLASATYVNALKECNAQIPQLSRYTVLDKGRNTLSGWSHVKKAKVNNEFRALNLNDADYLITPEYYTADKGCGFVKVQNVILAVKLSDWDRQHSNGLEALIDDADLTFAEVGYVLVDFRINRIGTSVGDVDTLRQRYGDYLTAQEFAEFDKGEVNLGIVLSGSPLMGDVSRSLSANLLVSIEHQAYLDQWLRLIAPIGDFKIIDNSEESRADISLSELDSSKISSFTINPETSQGNQLRNLLGDKWSQHLPETFKEYSISIRRIELLKRR